MSTIVSVNTYTHSVAYITDKMLSSIKYLIRLSGLDPSKFIEDWITIEFGIKTWLSSRHLEKVILEVYKSVSGSLVGRWDFEIEYDYGSNGDGSMWIDTDAIRYAIEKCGINPSGCEYKIVATTKTGAPDLQGWGSTTLSSLDGFQWYSVGTTIGANSLANRAGYWKQI
jgi:hypothetical protein